MDVVEEIQGFINSGLSDVLVEELKTGKDGKLLIAEFYISMVAGGRRTFCAIHGKDEKQLVHKVKEFLSRS